MNVSFPSSIPKREGEGYISFESSFWLLVERFGPNQSHMSLLKFG